MKGILAYEAFNQISDTFVDESYIPGAEALQRLLKEIVARNPLVFLRIKGYGTLWINGRTDSEITDWKYVS